MNTKRIEPMLEKMQTLSAEISWINNTITLRGEKYEEV